MALFFVVFFKCGCIIKNMFFINNIVNSSDTHESPNEVGTLATQRICRDPPGDCDGLALAPERTTESILIIFGVLKSRQSNFIDFLVLWSFPQ